MGNQECRDVVLKRRLHHFARMNARAVDGAAKDLLARNDLMAIRKLDDREDCALEVGEANGQVFLGVLHVLNDRTFRNAPREDIEGRAYDLGVADRCRSGLRLVNKVRAEGAGMRADVPAIGTNGE